MAKNQTKPIIIGQPKTSKLARPYNDQNAGSVLNSIIGSISNIQPINNRASFQNSRRVGKNFNIKTSSKTAAKTSSSKTASKTSSAQPSPKTPSTKTSSVQPSPKTPSSKTSSVQPSPKTPSSKPSPKIPSSKPSSTQPSPKIPSYKTSSIQPSPKIPSSKTPSSKPASKTSSIQPSSIQPSPKTPSSKPASKTSSIQPSSIQPSPKTPSSKPASKTSSIQPSPKIPSPKPEENKKAKVSFRKKIPNVNIEQGKAKQEKVKLDTDIPTSPRRTEKVPFSGQRVLLPQDKTSINKVDIPAYEDTQSDTKLLKFTNIQNKALIEIDNLDNMSLVPNSPSSKKD